jgi:hypothetical protein
MLGQGTANVGFAVPGTAGIPLISQGASADPSFGTALVVGGGTGATTFTTHGVLVGTGTSPIVALAAATNGQVLLGATSANPAFQTLTGDVSVTSLGVTAVNQITGSIGGTLNIDSPATGASTINIGTGSAGADINIGTSASSSITLGSLGFGANLSIGATTTFNNLTSSGPNLVYANASGTIGVLTGGNGQMLFATGSPTVVWETVTGDVHSSTITTGQLTVLSLTGSGGIVNIATTGSALIWAVGTVSPSIQQIGVTSAGAAQPMSIIAQGQNGSGTGGNLLLSSGYGSASFAAGGSLELQVSNNTQLLLTPVGLRPARTTISISTGTYNLSTLGDLFYPGIALSGTMTGNVTIDWGSNANGVWFVDCSEVNNPGEAHTLLFQNGSGQAFVTGIVFVMNASNSTPCLIVVYCTPGTIAVTGGQS